MNNHWVDVSFYDTKNTDLRVANDNKTTEATNCNEISCAYLPDQPSNYNYSSPTSLPTYLETCMINTNHSWIRQEFRDLDFVERDEILEQITQFEGALEVEEEEDDEEEESDDISLFLNFTR